LPSAASTLDANYHVRLSPIVSVADPDENISVFYIGVVPGTGIAQGHIIQITGPAPDDGIIQDVSNPWCVLDVTGAAGNLVVAIP